MTPKFALGQTMEWELISPDIAREYLAKNIKTNRNIRKNRVEFYAQQMESGQWDMASTDNKITFNENGELVDGQHRLRAVMKSKSTIWMRVFRNVKSSFFDGGITRTMADRVSMKGVELVNGTFISSIANFLYKVRENQSKPLSDGLFEAFYEDNASMLQFAGNVVARGKVNGKGLAKKASIAAAAFVALKNGVSEQKLIDFFTVVNTGFPVDFVDCSPCIVLRNQLLAYESGGRLTGGGATIRDIQYNLTTQAINAFVQSLSRKKSFDTGLSAFENTLSCVKREVVPKGG